MIYLPVNYEFMILMIFLWSTASSCGGLSTRHGTFGVGLHQRAEQPLLCRQAQSVEIVQPGVGSRETLLWPFLMEA